MTFSSFLRRLRRGCELLHDGFYGRISAMPFGLFRIGWAIAAFFSLATQWPRLTILYSDAGVFPPEWSSLFSRTYYHFSLLTYVHDPVAVQCLYGLTLLTLVCLALGVWTRVAAIAGAVLLTSFQEYSYAAFAGGDSVLRTTGFILAIAPGISALSLDRLAAQRRIWLERGETLPPLTMPSWPRLMLTWQMVVIYMTAAWYKLLDPMWRNGAATVASMNHLEFTRFSQVVGRIFASVSLPLTWGTIAWQLSWSTLLIPRHIRRRFPMPWRSYRRWIIGIGVIFHGLIFFFLDAGIFSIAMFATYLGVLDEDDYAAMRDALNRRFAPKGPIIVLYDGHCSFCRTTVLPLILGDFLKRLSFVDFRREADRKKAAPDIPLAALDEALHVRFPSGRTERGYDAIAVLAWHIPWMMPLAPFLLLPGLRTLGRWGYAKVAQNRYCLMGSACRLHA